jgi:two-component system OmpR family response regulator
MDKNTAFTVFLVDDDKMYLKAAQTQLQQQKKVNIKTFASGEECLKNIHLNPNIVFLDYSLDSEDANAKNGIQILKKIKSINENINVVMLSGQSKLEVAVEAMKNGAYDYVMKNEDAHLRIQNIIANLLKNISLENRLKSQKKMNTILIIAFIVIILGSYILGSMGVIF